MSSSLIAAPELDWRALMMLPESEWPDCSHLVTEDDTPVDNLVQAIQPFLLEEPLESSWKVDEPFVVNSDVGIFDHVGPALIVPDFLLALNVTRPQDLQKKENRAYFLWVYKKPPDVVLEIVSNKVGGEGQNGRKAKIYAKLGVPCYVVYDPFHYLSNDDLIVYELDGKRYRRRPDHQLPGVKLMLVIWEGTVSGLTRKWLRWATPDGKLIPRGVETAEFERRLKEKEQRLKEQERNRADEEQRLKEQERDRADEEQRLKEQERVRAEQAEQRARLLAEKLRQLGIAEDP